MKSGASNGLSFEANKVPPAIVLFRLQKDPTGQISIEYKDTDSAIQARRLIIKAHAEDFSQNWQSFDIFLKAATEPHFAQSWGNDAVSSIINAAIDLLPPILPPEQVETTAELLFNLSKSLISRGNISDGLTIWMRWLVVPSPLSTFCSFHKISCYFDTLLFALQESTSVNDRKFCLAILKTSIVGLGTNMDGKAIKFDVAQKEEYIKAYYEYCNIFEIVVMGRYLNQIQECLPLFPTDGTETLVSRDWWVLLYTAGMNMQSGTPRKLFGGWLLQNFGLEKGKIGERSFLFLEDFLAWAAQGQLLFKSLIRNGRTARSEHGAALSVFCARLVKQNPHFTEWLLSWLSRNSSTLNQYSTAYLLQGLSDAKVTQLGCANAFELAENISPSFSPFLRLVIRNHCLRLIKRFPLDEQAQLQRYNERKIALELQINTSLSLLDGDTGPFILTNNRQSFDSQIKTNIDVIFERLVSKGYIARSENGTITINWDHIQRYDPHQVEWRLLAEAWPYWLEESLSKGQSVGEATEFAANCISQFFQISRGKAFLWKISARNLRSIYLTLLPGILHHHQVEAAIMAFINEPPSPKAEYLLDVAVSGPEVDERDEKIYNVIAEEKMGHAYVFDMLARLRPSDASWALKIFDKSLVGWLKDKSNGSVSKWKKTSQIQAMVVLVNRCLLLEADVQKYYKHFMTLLANEANPRYRYLLEWLILHVCRVQAHLYPTFMEDIFNALDTADPSNPNPRLVASLIKVGVQLVLHPPINVDVSAEHMEHLLSTLTTFMGSPRIPIRFEAQSSFPSLYEYATNTDLHKSMTCIPVFRSVYSFVTGLEKWKNLPEVRVLGAFDLKEDLNLATLFEGGYLYLPQSEPPLLYAEDLSDVIHSDIPDVAASRSPSLLPIGTINGPAAALIKTMKDLPTLTTPISTAEMASAPLQTKYLSYDLTSLSISMSDSSSNAEKTTGNGPILIGTLLDQPVNLGGLSRAANVFGANSLHIPDITIIQSNAFKNVSVNSELHLSIQETKPENLRESLRRLKGEGWSVVGIEQTSESHIIGVPDEEDGGGKVQVVQGMKKIPKKAVIVMGAEKTGIPAEILFECDVCIEIKQWGVIRSLNVQTAAACVLFEWRREWGDGM